MTSPEKRNNVKTAFGYVGVAGFSLLLFLGMYYYYWEVTLSIIILTRWLEVWLDGILLPLGYQGVNGRFVIVIGSILTLSVGSGIGITYYWRRMLPVARAIDVQHVSKVLDQSLLTKTWTCSNPRCALTWDFGVYQTTRINRLGVELCLCPNCKTLDKIVRFTPPKSEVVEPIELANLQKLLIERDKQLPEKTDEEPDFEKCTKCGKSFHKDVIGEHEEEHQKPLVKKGTKKNYTP